MVCPLSHTTTSLESLILVTYRNNWSVHIVTTLRIKDEHWQLFEFDSYPGSVAHVGALSAQLQVELVLSRTLLSRPTPFFSSNVIQWPALIAHYISCEADFMPGRYRYYTGKRLDGGVFTVQPNLLPS